jgi:hypothetical protein
MATLKNTTINDTGYFGLPTGSTAQRPGSLEAGMIRWNTTTSKLEGYNGTEWRNFSLTTLGTSTNPASSATALINAGITENGYYYIKPTGYTGSAFEVFCDLDGTASGITGDAGWHRVEYSQNYYSEASPQGNLGIGNHDTVEFTFNLSLGEIQALLDNASESRINFVRYGYGSVGWTYQNQSGKTQRYMGVSLWFDGTTGGVDANRSTSQDNWPSTSLNYSFTDINTFDNTGTDPTDINDSVWRRGEIFIQDTSATYLPIRKIQHADIDGATELHHFPFVTENSYTWIK